jgi:hypothetical protein
MIKSFNAATIVQFCAHSSADKIVPLLYTSLSLTHVFTASLAEVSLPLPTPSCGTGAQSKATWS